MLAEIRSFQTQSSEKMRNVMKIQHRLLGFFRDFFEEKGFLQFLPPIIGPATDPGIRGARKIVFDYYGRNYYIMSSAILYKQALVTSFAEDNDVKGMWFLSPNVRLERPETSVTGRHLTEFVQVDVEMPHATYTQAMKLCEELLCYVCKRITQEGYRELESISRTLDIRSPFPRMTHHETVGMLKKKGFKIDNGGEIPWEEEKILSEMFHTPFFITDYPKGSRGFYDREDPHRKHPNGSAILNDFDLLYPEGFGEAVSGGEREYEYDKVISRMRETGENPDSYDWYVEMLKEGIVPSAGFGMGVERLTRFVCGLDSVAHARPFAKVAGVFSA